MFKKNIGTTDRLLRLSFGVVLLALAWWWSSWILLACALFCFYEALASWCVYYQLIGKNSCPISPDKRDR
ncbi:MULTISPECIES: YgaP family membrane protein [Parachlamydia]|uniref:Inner membrane protein YgaP-like transmembrane domain-containing protein n=1 Tax=Parachlamydia acanthamoebae TaxID=83552 RepID=A0A0C1EPP4_9BACT|nr:DUF2892 domain-containing protein [Parachlamydia acanthamoebae]KIA78209.1 hypothetical protein DB43_EL00200 [Parachlamydia acanthamoebae]